MRFAYSFLIALLVAGTTTVLLTAVLYEPFGGGQSEVGGMGGLFAAVVGLGVGLVVGVATFVSALNRMKKREIA